MDTVVEHDQTSTVHNCRTDRIDVDDSETVGGNQTLRADVRTAMFYKTPVNIPRPKLSADDQRRLDELHARLTRLRRRASKA